MLAEHTQEDAFQLPVDTAAQPTDQPLMIGITGRRNVGKSTVAEILSKEYGFVRTHAFEGGKKAAMAFFKHVTGSPAMAWEMVHGSLKDKPSAFLPGNQSPRYYLESTGQHAGVTLGIEWTLGLEIARTKRMEPGVPIVVESVVYEADWFKGQGGLILRLERPGFESPAGHKSDAAQAQIEADHTISAGSLVSLRRQVAEWMDELTHLILTNKLCNKHTRLDLVRN